MYYALVSRISGFWWAAIFYMMAIMVHFHGTELIGEQLRTGGGLSLIDLLAVTVSGIYVFGVGIHLQKTKLPYGVKMFFKLFGMFFLSAAITSFSLALGLSAANAVTLLFICWTLIFTYLLVVIFLELFG